MTNIQALNELKRLRAEATGLFDVPYDVAHQIAAMAFTWPRLELQPDAADRLIERAERGIAIMTATALR